VPGSLPKRNSVSSIHMHDAELAGDGERTFSFGPFGLHPRERLLLEGENLLRIGRRALNIFVALAERAGQLVSKDKLMASGVVEHIRRVGQSYGAYRRLALGPARWSR
jgi:DNA-binding response OmpR family regulator